MRPSTAGRLVAAVVLVAAAAVSTGSSGATFTSSTASAPSTVTAAADWSAPLVGLSVPDSPLAGTVPIEVDATDTEGSDTVVSVDVAVSGTEGWVEICAPASPPLACSWDTTTIADGRYDVRATATDSSGNTAQETAVGIVANSS